ncbi:MAG: mechanosensitive ion channel, partial [Burkholderiales bacterium]|nr:mechanosensitive ion channel [Burkholderiales bacterium]
MSPIREYTLGVIKLLIGTIQSYQVNVITYLAAVAVLAVLVLLIFYMLKILVFGLLRRWARNKKLIFLRVITHNKTLNVIPHLISAMLFLSWIRFVQRSTQIELIIQQFVRYAVLLYVFICLALLITRLVWAINTYYEKKFEFAHEYPIYSYIKVVILLIWVIWTVLVAAYFAGMSPISILTGIGAISAVVILIFKDTILGVVASIQITASNIVNIGDRITIDRYNVDGEVLDIAINTVKVKNSDNTIATIPTYVLISEVVKNWRGMVHAGARRIKRAIHIDINTIAKCTPELLESLRHFRIVNDYINKHPGKD